MRKIDLEKTIKGLEICKAYLLSKETCKITGCPYADVPEGTYEYKNCRKIMMADAISLLKMYEPVEPYMDYDDQDVWRCANCGSVLFRLSHTHRDENQKNFVKFCQHCGRAVKWNES